MAEKSSSSVYWEGLKSWMAVLREDFSGILLCSRNRGRMSLSGLCDLPKLEEYHEAIPRHPFTAVPSVCHLSCLLWIFPTQGTVMPSRGRKAAAAEEMRAAWYRGWGQSRWPTG